MAKSPEELAREAAREKQKKAAEAIDKAWNKVSGKALPEALSFLGLSGADQKTVIDGFNAFESIAVAAVTGSWFDAVGKVATLLSDILSGPGHQTLDVAQQSFKLVSAIYEFLSEEDRKERQAEVNELLQRTRTAAIDTTDNFKGLDHSLAWLSALDYATIKERTDDAAAAVDAFLGVGNQAGLPGHWHRWYRVSEIAGRPWAGQSDQGAWFAQFYDPSEPVQGWFGGPLDRDHDVFDYRVPLAALSAMLPWTMAAIALREPFWKTTGRFRQRFTDWADVLEGLVLPAVDRTILRATWPNALAWTTDGGLGQPERLRWLGIAAGVVNIATTEAVATGGWAPGMYVEGEADGSYTIYGAAAGTGWPDDAERDPGRQAENDAYVALVLPNFNDACEGLLKQRMPYGILRKMIADLRSAAAHPEVSETFGPSGFLAAILPGPDVSAGTGTIAYEGAIHTADLRLRPTKVRLARPHVDPPGGEPGGLKLDPGPTVDAGLVIQWPQMHNNSNQVMPIRYRIGLRGRGVADADIAWLVAVDGGDPEPRSHAGEVTVPCSTFDFLVGGRRPRLLDDRLVMPDLAGLPAFPAPDAALHAQVTLPPFEGEFGDHTAKGMMGPVTDAEVRLGWTVEVQGGALTVTISDPDDVNVTDVEVVIDEGLAQDWEGPFAALFRVRTSTPLVMVPRRIVAPKGYWDALAEAGAALERVIRTIWVEIPGHGPVPPWGPVPREFGDPRRILQVLPGGIANAALHAALLKEPLARRLFEG